MQDRTKPTLDLGETAFRKRTFQEAKAAAAAAAAPEPMAVETEAPEKAAAGPGAPSRFAARSVATVASSDEEEEADEEEDSDGETARIFHSQTGQFKKVKHSKATARKAPEGRKKHRNKRSKAHNVFL